MPLAMGSASCCLRGSLRAVQRPTALSTRTTTRVRIAASAVPGWRISVDEAMGEHGRERGMGAAFVKIGARYINLSAILWVEVQEEQPEPRLVLVYHTCQDGDWEQLTLQGDEATKMRDILQNIKRN